MSHTNYCRRVDCVYRGCDVDEYQCSAKNCQVRLKQLAKRKNVNITTIAPGIWERIKLRTK